MTNIHIASKHKASLAGGNIALELFRLPPTETSVLSGKYQTYYPDVPIQQGNPIEFSIRTNEDYIDLSRCYMTVKLKVTKANGTDMDNTTVCLPVNNFMHTIIKQMSIKLNDTLVTQQNDTYAYKAYIQNLLNYSPDQAKSYMPNQLWYIDETGGFEHYNTTDGQPGFDIPNLVQRETFIHQSAIVQMMGPPCHDLFQSGKYMVGGIKFDIRIDLQPPAFCLMSANNGTQKVVILDWTFHLYHVKVAPDVRLKQIQVFSSGRHALYDLKRGDVQAYNIPANQGTFQVNDLFLGKIPKRIIIGFVRNDAFVGTRERNPFNFQLFNLKTLQLLVNGEEYPTPAIDMTDNGHVHGYNSLLLGMGAMYRGPGLQFSRTAWSTGFALFMWDLTPENSGNAEHMHPEFQGQVKIKGLYTQANNIVVTMIVYAEYEDILEVDGNKRIVYNLA